MRAAAGIAVLVLAGQALGARVPVPEIRRLHLAPRAPAAQPKGNELDKRITCIEDDYLLSLQMFIDDSYPSCSAYLGIPETTSITTVPARTTVIVIQTTYATIQETSTVPTATVTITETAGNVLAARTLKARDAAITPAATLFSMCAEATGLNASLIADVSSACSCLFITEKVNVVAVTSTSTRIESGIDYEQTTVVSTVTEGESTTTVTVTPTLLNATSSSGFATSVPATTAINSTSIAGTGSVSTPIVSPTIPGGSRTGVSQTPSSSPVYSGNSTAPPSPTATVGPPTISDCPADNGTIYTTQGQNFLIECYVNYGGPVTQGLVERTLYGCVDDCAIANVGFSQSRCYAASYFPNIIGPNCFFKTRESSLTPFHNEMTISALLLNPLNTSSAASSSIPPFTGNATSTPVATGSSVSSSAVMTSNFTSGPGTSIPTSVSSTPSLFPSVTANVTSSTPSPSISGSALSTGNGSVPVSSGTAPYSYSSGTVPHTSTTQPYSRSSTGTAPPFSISMPSQSRIIPNNSTQTPTQSASSCPASQCISYVYSTSVIFTTSVIWATVTEPISPSGTGWWSS